MAWCTRVDVGQFEDVKAFCRKADEEIQSLAGSLSVAKARAAHLKNTADSLRECVRRLIFAGDAIIENGSASERLAKAWSQAKGEVWL